MMTKSAVEPEIALTEDERALCAFIDGRRAELSRTELRALYAIGHKVQEHRLALVGAESESLRRCSERLGTHRTTLCRYSFVARRIREGEFDSLIALSDPRGYPVAFWNLIEVAQLSREQRCDAIVEHLMTRRPGSMNRIQLQRACAGTSGLNEGAPRP
jgi:hypothetical protein